MILVVGATGALGTRVVRRLSVEGRDVRALVRPMSEHGHLQGLPRVQIAYGDLRDAASVDAAVAGTSHIVATASAIIPRAGDRLEDIDRHGYRTLIDAAVRHQVERFVMVSLAVTPYDDQIEPLRVRRETERYLEDSGVPYAIVQSEMFMEAWLALPGSSIPLRREEAPTLRRPFKFQQLYRRATGELVEKRGVMLVPGSAERRNAFIATDDVAKILVAALDHPRVENQVIAVGGPRALDWNEVAEIYSRLLGKRVRVITTPAAVFHAQQRLLRPVAPTVANMMALNRFAALVDGQATSEPWASILEVGPMKTVEEFLAEKVALA